MRTLLNLTLSWVSKIWTYSDEHMQEDIWVLLSGYHVFEFIQQPVGRKKENPSKLMNQVTLA